jgi:hypothetical protein
LIWVNVECRQPAKRWRGEDVIALEATCLTPTLRALGPTEGFRFLLTPSVTYNRHMNPAYLIGGSGLALAFLGLLFKFSPRPQRIYYSKAE